MMMMMPLMSLLRSGGRAAGATTPHTRRRGGGRGGEGVARSHITAGKGENRKTAGLRGYQLWAGEGWGRGRWGRPNRDRIDSPPEGRSPVLHLLSAHSIACAGHDYNHENHSTHLKTLAISFAWFQLLRNRSTLVSIGVVTMTALVHAY